jgi:hypothetical protein
MQLNLGSGRDRTVLATALLIVGVTGTVLNPDGPVGIVLFGVAAAALVYLIAGPLQRGFGLAKSASLRRSPRPSPRTPAVPSVARVRTVAGVAAVMSVLFTVWLTVDLSRPLVYVCWWSFCLLGAWILTIGLLSATRQVRAAR